MSMGNNLGPKRVVQGLQDPLFQIDEAEIVAHQVDDLLNSKSLADGTFHRKGFMGGVRRLGW
jgi:hypothetical protein